MADFELFWKTLTIEGGYSNRENDYGGETYMGLSKRWNSNWPGWAEIEKYKAASGGTIKHNAKFPDLQESVKQYYRTEYWNKMKGDQINDQSVANMLADVKVNGGWAKGGIIEKVQGEVGAKVDGKWGTGTIEAINKHKDQSGLLNSIYDARKAHYDSEVLKNPKQMENYKGWINRIDELKKSGSKVDLKPVLGTIVSGVQKVAENISGGK